MGQPGKDAKSEIRKVFWQLYEVKGIEKISVSEIMERAGYNRGTFYLHYQDIYDLLEQCEDELLETIEQVIREANISQGSLDLSQQMGFLMELTQMYSEFVKILLSDRGDARFARRFKQLLWPYLKQYFVPIKGYTEQQEQWLAEFFLSGLLSAIAVWLSDPQDVSLKDFIDFMLPNMFRAAGGD